MIGYFIDKPIAVLGSFIAVLLLGLWFFFKVPVSLLPVVDVPEIMIRVNYPNASAPEIEEKIVKPMREGLANLFQLKNIESTASDHVGVINLTFGYGTRMDLAYISVNEKLDLLTNSLPRDLQRPQVIQASTSDIAVVRIQVTPKNAADITAVSTLCEKNLKRRLEQLEGVSLVDMNGKRRKLIYITPHEEQLISLGLQKNALIQVIQNSNVEIGGLTVQNGQYQYFVKDNNTLDNINDLYNLPVRLTNGSIVLLKELASIELEPEPQTGYHLYNGKESIVITVQKQADSRMHEVMNNIQQVVTQFSQEFPALEFNFTQDQSFLMTAGIDNLKQDIIYGGVLTILLLFLFLGNWASPLLMSINIPLSLIITFLFFYLFNISFNIISLSGLALGIGMLIDNSIVVIDNITRFRSTGLSMRESSIKGTTEVVVPVISQVLTTVAVYAPLILLNGMAGALVYEQGIALTISLGVSLLVAFVLTPLLYNLFLHESNIKQKQDTALFLFVLHGYHKMIDHILHYRRIYLVITILFMLSGIWFAKNIPIRGLPYIEQKESLVLIDWNEPIDAAVNGTRIKELQAFIRNSCTETEAEVGIKQFLLQQDYTNVQKADLYYNCTNAGRKNKTDHLVNSWMAQKFPRAHFTILDAPNAFTQLFISSQPYYEIRLRPIVETGANYQATDLDSTLARMKLPAFKKGKGLIREENLSLTIDYRKLLLYNVDITTIRNSLQQLFGDYHITELKKYGELNPISYKTPYETLEQKLNSPLRSNNGTYYPVKIFLNIQHDQQPRFVTADRNGKYYSLLLDNATYHNSGQAATMEKHFLNKGLRVDYAGQFFDDRKQISNLWYIFLIVLLVLYFILAFQYEDLVMPIIVMLTIPIGVSGGMMLLWATGNSLDVMSVIGFIIIMGLIVDDPILKVETLKRLENKYRSIGMAPDKELLKKMIHEAGNICLKPLLMVSLTTSIALVPVLFFDGIGNDLQIPMAIVVIGGLTIGTFFTTWFIPIAYWYVSQWKNRNKKPNLKTQ